MAVGQGPKASRPQSASPVGEGGEELEVSAFSAVVVVGRRDRFLTHFTLKLLAGCPTSVLC